jgi:hypothetical protein
MVQITAENLNKFGTEACCYRKISHQLTGHNHIVRHTKTHSDATQKETAIDQQLRNRIYAYMMNINHSQLIRAHVYHRNNRLHQSS